MGLRFARQLYDSASAPKRTREHKSRRHNNTNHQTTHTPGLHVGWHRARCPVRLQ